MAQDVFMFPREQFGATSSVVYIILIITNTKKSTKRNCHITGSGGAHIHTFISARLQFVLSCLLISAQKQTRSSQPTEKCDISRSEFSINKHRHLSL